MLRIQSTDAVKTTLISGVVREKKQRLEAVRGGLHHLSVSFPNWLAQDGANGERLVFGLSRAGSGFSPQAAPELQ